MRENKGVEDYHLGSNNDNPQSLIEGRGAGRGWDMDRVTIPVVGLRSQRFYRVQHPHTIVVDLPLCDPVSLRELLSSSS